MRAEELTRLAICIALYLGLSLALQQATSFPGEFDELQHISYAAHLQEHRAVLPAFERHRTLAADDLRRWTERANYVGHPSPFYLFLAPLLDRGLPPERAAVPPRLASAGLLLLGVGLTLWFGQRHFADDRWAALLFCAAVALCPKLVAVSSQVTNDSLAFLGGALAYAGVCARERRSTALVALGLSLALWAKPSAGLLVGVWLALLWLMSRPRPPGFTLGIAVGAFLGCLPYLPILATYGRLVPVTAEQLGFTRAEQLDSFAAYLPAFVHQLGFTWPIMQNGGWITVALFWTMLGCIAAAAVLAWPRRGETAGAIAVAAPLAMVLILPVHLGFASSSLGYSLPAASFRYYLPLWPALAHSLAFGVATARAAWWRGALAGIGVAALVAGWTSP